jgi:SAM-dependent methyltransferase
MIVDTQLASLEQSMPKTNVVWSNYAQTYDWTWIPESQQPAICPKSPEHADRCSALLLRGSRIAQKLKEKGIKRVLDIGADTGYFLAQLTAIGIEAVGIDANKMCCEYIATKGINHCYCIDIEQIIKNSLSGFDCITCMNITHARWKDETLKMRLISWIAQNTDWCILSDMSHQYKKWANLKLEHDFSFLRYPYNKTTQRLTSAINVDSLIHYTCIQKLFSIKR